MRANIRTLLSLFEYAEIIQLNPFWVSQIREGIPRKGQAQNISCDHTMYQSSWQGFEHLGREEIAQSIVHAEKLVAKLTGYYPAPKYFTEEPHSYPGYTMRRNYFPYVQARHRLIQAIGTEMLTAVGDTAVTLSSSYSGTFNDTFTATITVPAGTTADEIAAFFIAVDRAGLSLAQTEIKPLTVSISGTTATFKGHITLLVKPVHQVAPDAPELDATAAGTYVTQISVYRRTVDLSDTGSLVWVKPTDCANPPCEVEMKTACFSMRDAKKGWLEPVPATYDEEAAAFALSDPYCVNTLPHQVKVNYLAGYPRQEDGRMDYGFARAVALLATSLLPNRTAGCNRADQRILYYRNLPVDESGNLQVPRSLMEAAGKIFGTMGRGACEALLLLEPELSEGVSG